MTAQHSGAPPLTGIRVLDVSTFIAAPLAATVMADYGADVIKVEAPGGGDPNRTTKEIASYPKSPVNYPWEMDSRGKRSIVIDLRQPAGQQVLGRLIKRADVLITNFPLEVRARLGLAYERVAPLNDRLVYASFTGYGEHGPDAHQLGFDATAYFARSGLADCNRYEGQPPGVAMPAQGDRGSGMTLFGAIMLALFQRQGTGRGTLVTSSLLANGLWANGVGAQAALVGAFLPPRPPRDRPRSAIANIYRTRDDRWLQLTIVQEERMWPTFCRVMELGALEHDPRFAETATRRANAAALTAILDPIFSARDFADWRALFQQHGIPFGLIFSLRDLPSDEQAVASGAVVATGNPDMPLTLAAPFGLASAPVPPATRAPGLGEHTDAILAEAGLTSVEIAALRSKLIVG
jgi:formyl-CoA transferase